MEDGFTSQARAGKDRLDLKRNVYILWTRLQNHFINDMNDTITGHNIRSHNIGSTTIEIDLNASFGRFHEIDSFTTDSLDRSSSNSGSGYLSGDNMSQDNGLLLIIGQRGQNGGVNFGKSCVRGSKDSQGFGALQSVNQTQITDNGDQGLERTGANCDIDHVGFTSPVVFTGQG